jgi:hypothetical protein
MHAGVQSLIVTLGKRGAVYFLSPGFDRLTDLRRAPDQREGAVRTALVPAEQVDSPGDPTESFRAAIRAASRNVTFRGAGGLASFLRGELLQT